MSRDPLTDDRDTRWRRRGRPPAPLPSTVPQTARDALLLVGRVLLGVVLIAHGWQKFAQYGLGGTAAAFAQMGVPAPAVSAVVELVRGLALLVGAGTMVVGVLVVLDTLGAFVLVYLGNGIFVQGNGFELVSAIAAAALAFVAVGAGRLSVDQVLLDRRRAAVRA